MKVLRYEYLNRPEQIWLLVPFKAKLAVLDRIQLYRHVWSLVDSYLDGNHTTSPFLCICLKACCLCFVESVECVAMLVVYALIFCSIDLFYICGNGMCVQLY